MLSEFKVGAGRMMMTGLVLAEEDPAGNWLKHELLAYLSGHDHAAAPEWDPEDLRRRLRQGSVGTRREIAVDAGGRPAETV